MFELEFLRRRWSRTPRITIDVERPHTELPNLYESFFQDRAADAPSLLSAANAAANAYLDGKPTGSNRNKIGSARRDADFWACDAWDKVPLEAWRSQLLTLALARYFSQEQATNTQLVDRIAAACPDTVVNAVRYSGLVRRQALGRRSELAHLAVRHPFIAELNRILFAFSKVEMQCEEVLNIARALSEASTPFDLLVQASLYAFEHLVPAGLASAQRRQATTSNEQTTWDAINDIFMWKLATASADAFQDPEASITRAVGLHLMPVLNSVAGRPDAGQPTREAFRALVAAQIELNEFISRSADAFSYDDAIRFVRQGTSLDIVVVDEAQREAWSRHGRRLSRLHEYWFYRAVDAFALSGMATQTIGRQENSEANRLAWIHALRTRLRLSTVYGVADTVNIGAGSHVDVFQALLSVELMSSFFQRDVLQAFETHRRNSGDWRVALRRLAEGGFRDGMQLRLPLTWSDRSAKIANITGWTVNAESPHGNPVMAGAILDFWTSDWVALSERLRSPSETLRPSLLERPVLKFNALLVQLPWQVGMQNNGTAAINNLRRLGQRREQALEETQRIEAGLGEALEARGFAVVLNWMPDRQVHGDAGEVDVVGALGNVILVLEVKSTFMRMSQKEAFLHSTTTLRKAAGQLQRKVRAVRQEIATPSALGQALQLSVSDPPRLVRGWIVDTSIESDHQSFDGFLKVSLEEVLIALRDDAHLLRDPDGIFRPGPVHEARATGSTALASTLYPEMFSPERFVAVIEDGLVLGGI